jgi:hypothetical protein
MRISWERGREAVLHPPEGVGRRSTQVSFRVCEPGSRQRHAGVEGELAPKRV